MSWGGNKGSAGDLSSNASTISNSSPCRNSTSTAQDTESSSPISVSKRIGEGLEKKKNIFSSLLLLTKKKEVEWERN